MKSHLRRAALLLPLVLSGCVHKTHQQAQQPLAPPIEDAPLPAPLNAPANLPPPVETKPEPTPPVNLSPPPKPQPANNPPKKTRHPVSKPSPATAAAPAPAPQQSAASNPPEEVSAVGNLSSSVASDSREQTLKTISDIEKGVNGLNRKLSEQEQKTSLQIHDFLRQARTALDTGDIDGAKTLTIKAKVLLTELTP